VRSFRQQPTVKRPQIASGNIFICKQPSEPSERKKYYGNERDAAAAWENARVSFCNRKNEIMHFLCDAVMGKVTSGMMN
jgi:hypothetical protein